MLLLNTNAVELSLSPENARPAEILSDEETCVRHHQIMLRWVMVRSKDVPVANAVEARLELVGGP